MTLTLERIAIICVLAAFLIAEVVHPTHWQPKSISHTSLASGGGANLTGVALDDLPPITKPAMGNIDVVERANAKGGWTALPAGATVPGNATLRLAGWLGDPQSQAAGSGLILMADDSRRFNVSGSYGTIRPDVEAYYKNPALAPTGFDVLVPAAELGPGLHHLHLGVISADGSGYFSFPVAVDVDVAS